MMEPVILHQMRKVKRILELHYVANMSNRAISRGVGRESVSRLLERATVANLSWPLPEGMTDAELEAVLYPATTQDAPQCAPSRSNEKTGRNLAPSLFVFIGFSLRCTNLFIWGWIPILASVFWA